MWFHDFDLQNEFRLSEREIVEWNSECMSNCNAMEAVKMVRETAVSPSPLLGVRDGSE